MGKKRAKDKSSREEDDIDISGKELIIIAIMAAFRKPSFSTFVCFLSYRSILQTYQEGNRPNSSQETLWEFKLDELPRLQQ